MTRRNGVLAALAAICGLMSGRYSRAGDSRWVETRDTHGNVTSITAPKGAVTMPLDSFTEYNFTLGNETVTLTPTEVMAALKEPH